MEDSGKPTGSEAPFSSTGLTDRLLERADRPLGLIDTRPVQQIHARAAAWVADKVGLLEGYASRFRIVESIPQATPAPLLRPASAGFVESPASVTSAGLTSALSRGTRGISAANKTSLPGPDEFSSRRRASDSGEFVVRKTNSDVVAAHQTEGPVSKDSAQPSDRTKGISGQTGSSPVNLHLRRIRADATSSGVSGSNSLPLLGAPKPSGTQPILQRKQAEGANPAIVHVREIVQTVAAREGSAHPVIQRADDGSKTAKSATSSEVTGNNSLPLLGEPKLSGTQPILQRKQTEGANPAIVHVREIVQTAAARDGSARAVIQRADDGSRTAESEASSKVAGSNALPLLGKPKPSATQASLQRKQIEAANPAIVHVREIAQAAAAREGSAHPVIQRADDGSGTAKSAIRPAAVVKETYPARAPAQSPSLIFRNTEAHGRTSALDGPQNRSLSSGSTRAQAPPVQRRARSLLSSDLAEPLDSRLSAPSYTGPEFMQTPSGSGGIDAGEVAEQVTRMISRRLAVERERRGRAR
jgi:hypothetical protein